MAQTKIRIADNDRDFLETRLEFIAEVGYQVFVAFYPLEVLEKSQQQVIDSGIIDIRLSNDGNEKAALRLRERATKVSWMEELGIPVAPMPRTWSIGNLFGDDDSRGCWVSNGINQPFIALVSTI